MNGSHLEELFDRQRALLARTFEQSLQELDNFRANMVMTMQLTSPPLVALPSKDKEDESSSSIINVDYSSSSSISSPKRPPSKVDINGFKRFIGDFKRGQSDYALCNVWFHKKWGRQLDGIRNNLKGKGKKIFDTIIQRSLSDIPLSITESGHDGYDICSLCNLNKRCTQQVDGHLLATCCAPLAEALIAFFEYIWWCVSNVSENWAIRFVAADQLFASIIEGKKK